MCDKVAGAAVGYTNSRADSNEGTGPRDVRRLDPVRDATVLEALNLAIERQASELARLIKMREHTPHNVLSMQVGRITDISRLINPF